jgi:hypothetical protein
MLEHDNISLSWLKAQKLFQLATKGVQKILASYSGLLGGKEIKVT